MMYISQTIIVWADQWSLFVLLLLLLLLLIAIVKRDNSVVTVSGPYPRAMQNSWVNGPSTVDTMNKWNNKYTMIYMTLTLLSQGVTIIILLIP